MSKFVPSIGLMLGLLAGFSNAVKADDGSRPEHEVSGRYFPQDFPAGSQISDQFTDLGLAHEYRTAYVYPEQYPDLAAKYNPDHEHWGAASTIIEDSPTGPFWVVLVPVE